MKLFHVSKMHLFTYSYISETGVLSYHWLYFTTNSFVIAWECAILVVIAGSMIGQLKHFTILIYKPFEERILIFSDKEFNPV